MGEAVSLGVHESQSRLWENAVGRSRAVLGLLVPPGPADLPRGPPTTSPSTSSWPPSTTSSPGLIRVQADEVTYNLHIIVRFELEQALLSGDLPTADLPGAWNEKYRELLGVTPANDARGLPPGHPLERRARRLLSQPIRSATSTPRNSSPGHEPTSPGSTSPSRGATSASSWPGCATTSTAMASATARPR